MMKQSLLLLMFGLSALSLTANGVIIGIGELSERVARSRECSQALSPPLNSLEAFIQAAESGHPRELSKSAINRLRRNLPRSIGFIFQTLKSNSNRYVRSGLSRVVNDLLIEPQAREIEESEAANTKELWKLYGGNWSAGHVGSIISSRAEWMVDIALELRQSPGVGHFVDIGSGHGLPSLLLGQEFPNVEFIGFDLVEAKVRAATEMTERLQLHNVSFVTQDLSAADFTLPVAEVYYFFNPVNPEVLSRMADQIITHAKTHSVKVLSASGGGEWVTRTFTEKGCALSQA